MSGEAGAVADIATGDLLARQVDGDAAPAGHGGGACPNCGTALVGPYCHACGQAGHVHRTVAAIGHDILHGVFHFEGKLVATLPLLALHPGRLTRRYIDGERAKFVSPMALFLFSVFLLFAVTSQFWTTGGDHRAATVGQARERLVDAAERQRDSLADLKEARADLIADKPGADTRAIDARIAKARTAADALERAARNPASGTVEAHGPAEGLALATRDVRTGNPSLDAQIGHVRENPELYAYKLKTASYKYSWALIPISVPLIWLLFCRRRDVGLYDHAIFATYSLSFMTLLGVALVLVAAMGLFGGLPSLAFVVVPPLHMYRQLKGTYRLRRFGALWRTAALIGLVSVAASVFGLLLLWLEAH